ncbi:glycosyltransferase [Ancylobacter polymorphus]|uniref:Glycosyltransferase involved in cell wall biosynthesis n=1 Tax=Ancylobacter polymorphus TaxID=223390 RepID=A0ABU0B6T6_9HYPH|nr:glycosyltransferase [Ancylobacter polymorphus]MDQ0301535.1 glycosyltransferase involved in cell wall biosynthesis [Ancylobacter polymorphus]
MKIRLVLGHPADDFGPEVREGLLIEALCASGHDALAYRIAATHGKDSAFIRLFTNDAADDPDPHAACSSALLEQIRRDEPDVLIVKGADYRAVHSIIRAAGTRVIIASIVGGKITHRRHDSRIHIVLEEYEGQIASVRSAYLRLEHTILFPKLIRWDLAHLGDPRSKPYDVVNVGSFIPIKRQIDLLPLADTWRLCFVGDGPERNNVERQAKTTLNRPAFLGNVGAAEVYAAIRQSRLMVHPCTFEGFPRAFAESLAVGVPVVARQSTFRNLPPIPGIVLAPDHEILSVASAILNDAERLEALSAAARASAERWSNSALDSSVQHFISLVENLEVTYRPSLKERLRPYAEDLMDAWRQRRAEAQRIGR